MIKSYVKTKEGTEPIEAYTAAEVYLPSGAFEKWSQNKTLYQYAADFAVLDTETSHDGLRCGWIYQWAVKWRGMYIYGRTPSELLTLLRRMIDKYHLGKYRRLIIYVHNLSYDMAYLKLWLEQLGPLKVMATGTHTFLIVDVVGLRFLCSFKLSNSSLAMFAKTYADKYEKAVGEIDYTVVRYQDTKLKASDWFYMFSDVASQYDAITGYLQVNGYDRAYKAPYTSTGFVRVNCRNAAATALNWRKKFLTSALDLKQYQLCRQGIMGGITICSWLYEGQTVRVGVDGVKKLGHKDFTSSYPARQMMDYMPIGKGFWWGDVTAENVDFVLNTYCCVFLLTLKGVRMRQGITAPYIPSSKCLHLENPLKINGKVTCADELSIVVTELDYKWIKKQYIADDHVITNMLCFNRGSAPAWLKGEVMKYYNQKCNTPKDTKEYGLSKALLNSIYGLTATAICRDEYKYQDGVIMKAQANSQSQLTKYYNSYNSYMPYQYALYTTAWARNALMEMIECCGYENFLYCDTDSVFYISTPENEQALKAMNDRVRERAIKAGAYVGDKVLGVATDEPELRAFRGLHAKCYAVEEWDKKKQDYGLKVTIAGIPKKSIKWIDGKPVEMTNAEELGSIDNLVDGFVFRHCGGTRTVYIEDDPHVENVNGHDTEVASAAIIENIEKEISNTMWTQSADYTMLHINCAESL